MLPNFGLRIHLWFSLRIMVDDPSQYQTWLPPLLKIENLTNNSIKNSEKSCKRQFAMKLWVNDAFMIPFKNYGWWPQPPSIMVVTVTKNRKFDKNSIKKYSEKSCKGPFAMKPWVNDAFMIPFKTYGWWPQPPSKMITTVTKNRKFDKKFWKIL